MTVIASEISYVHPFTIDSLQSLPGERFDFVLNADKTANKDYWIRVKTILPCRSPVEAFAVLRYGDEHRVSADIKIAYTRRLPPRVSNDFPENKTFNVPEDRERSLLKMRAYRPDKSILSSPPDHKFFLFLDSPTVLDETLDSKGNYYRLSCKLQLKSLSQSLNAKQNFSRNLQN